MKVFVNEQPLDAQMADNEGPVQVYQAVDSWVRENHRFLLGMRADGVEILPGDLDAVEPGSVDRLEFFVGDEIDMVLVTVEELDNYVDQVGSTLFENERVSPEEKTQLCEGIQWIRQVMDSVSHILRLDLAAVISPIAGEDSLDAVLARIEKKAADINTGDSEGQSQALDAFVEELRNLKFYTIRLRLQLRTMHSGAEELVEAIEEFEKNIETLVESVISVNVAFQSGRDVDALASLDQITEKLHYYVAALYALEYQENRAGRPGIAKLALGGAAFDQKVVHLTNLLVDLSTALEEGDITAAGDILEYELTAAIKALAPYLPEIREVVAGKHAASDVRTS
ncbi:MAG: hypothetical protein HY042_00585 [Spirochaetia bacterium]|nr:hypothetical protein [Spirochaetia bacterium]